MNRKDFFRRIALVIGAAIVAPRLLKGEEDLPYYRLPENEWSDDAKQWINDQIVVTTKPTRISDDQLIEGRIIIQIDRELRINDTVYLPPTHTNKEELVQHLVVQQHVRLGKDFTYSIMPFDMTTKLVKSIRKDTPLFVGANILRFGGHNHPNKSPLG